MEQHVIDVITRCTQGSHDGTMIFPEIVQVLVEVGVSRYHVDLIRQEATYYLQNDESYVLHSAMPEETIAQAFDAAEVAAAVKASQNEGQSYHRFLVRVMQAGCIGYVAYLDGHRVVYGGRLGDMQIEYFPTLLKDD